MVLLILFSSLLLLLHRDSRKNQAGRLFMRWILCVYIFVKFNVPVHFYHDFVHIYTKVLKSFIFIFIFS